MRRVLTTQSTMTCGHAGHVQTAGTAKLTVNSNPVLLTDGVKGKTVEACITQDKPDQGLVKCRTVSSVDNTPAPKLAVDGEPVLVDTVHGETNGKVGSLLQKLLAANANQSKLVTT